MQKITLISLFLAVLFINGCATDGQDGSSCTVTDNGDGSATVVCTDGTSTTIGGPDCSVPASTIIMHYEWSEAEMFRRDCWDEADFHEHECLERGILTTSECFQASDEQEQWCVNFSRGWVNKIPVRECGAWIYSINGEPGDPDYSLTVNDEDSDGDGISNLNEYYMGLNPCTPNAYGSCVNDGDLDYDADGIPNSEDEFPRCNLDDPAEQFSDCI